VTITDPVPEHLWDRLDEPRQRAGRHVDGILDLSKGVPVDPAPDPVQRALISAADAPGYPLTAGTAEVREAAAAWLARCHRVRASPAQILPTIGSKEFLGLLPLLLGLRPGDAVVHPELAYPSYRTGAELVGATSIACDDPSTLAPVLPSGHRIRLVWLNTPANPTGRVLPVRTMRSIVAWARTHGVIVASDECYLDFGWTVQPTCLLAAEVAAGSPANLLAVHSMSKRSNLAGYRAGFVAGDPRLIHTLHRLRREIGLITPTPVQHAMVAALTDDAHVTEQRSRYARRRETLRSALESAGWTIDHSEAGLFLWARHPRYDSWQATNVLADHGILVTPGDLYGVTGRQHIRVAITATDGAVAAAAERLHAGQL
jgi:succinyldiaminopimelate transaminase